MYKKFTGIMSLAMAGMLAASSFAPASTAMAADEEVVLLEEAGDVAEEATLEEASEEELLLEDEAGEASSEEETVEITPENPEEENEEVENTLEFRNRWDSSDKCGNKITFVKQYQEYVYEFSEAFQAEDCTESDILSQPLGLPGGQPVLRIGFFNVRKKIHAYVCPLGFTKGQIYGILATIQKSMHPAKAVRCRWKP